MAINPLDLEEARIVTAELHAAIKDAAAVLKKMEQVKKDLVETSENVFKEHMATSIQQGLDLYAATIAEAVEGATDAVYARFDKITNLLLTGNTKGKGPDVEALIVEKIRGDERLQAAMDEALGR